MLKTSKIVIVGLSLSTVAMGSYIVYTQFFQTQKKVIIKKQTPSKVYDTIPEKDSSLDKLNRILADNNLAREKIVIPAGIEVETYENIDKNSKLYDSLIKAGSVVDPGAESHAGKNIFANATVIKAEKFILKKIFTILGYSSSSSEKDSLVNALVPIKNSPKGQITLEFWESPVNYKGYRLGRDKMIVFGVMPDGVNMVKHKSDLYMVTLNNVYLVRPCTEFCDLKPIKDKSVCAGVMSHVH